VRCDHVAVLPLAAILFALYFLSPDTVTNTISRTMEYEADMYGLNAAQQPDAKRMWTCCWENTASWIRPVEEFIFYDHPAAARASPRPCAGRPSIRSPHQPKRWRDRSSREVNSAGLSSAELRAALMLGEKQIRAELSGAP